MRLLAEWLLRTDGEDLVLWHLGREVNAFTAVGRSPPGWLQSLDESGFCLLIVGTGVGLGHPAAEPIQRAIRERRALMGLAEFDI